jgi:hypothetical protein
MEIPNWVSAVCRRPSDTNTFHQDPELHLVWRYDQVFLKPIPKCLLSHAFWEFYLGGNSVTIEDELKQNIAKAALGFLRPYAFLIQHTPDFLPATDKSNNTLLVPGKVSFSEFVGFISSSKRIADDDVSPRHQFGQLRLTRLNFGSKVVLRRFAFRRVGRGCSVRHLFCQVLRTNSLHIRRFQRSPQCHASDAYCAAVERHTAAFIIRFRSSLQRVRSLHTRVCGSRQAVPAQCLDTPYVQGNCICPQRSSEKLVVKKEGDAEVRQGKRIVSMIQPG